MQERIAIIYGSSDGQTRKISEYLASYFRERGADVATMHADEIPLDYALENSDAVLIGSSIRGSKHHRFVVDYVREHRDELSRGPNGFFSVSLSADTAEDPRSVAYVEQFREKTGWDPAVVGRFRGALRYSEYNWLLRPMMQKIAEEMGADTDTSRDWEYTDWEEVDAFADAFLEQISRWRSRGAPALN